MLGPGERERRPGLQPGGRERVRAALNLAPDTLLLLYVGRLAPEKRLDLLLRAVSLLVKRDLPALAADFRLALVGDGQCRAALEAAGWVTSAREVFYLHGRVWVARAEKGGRAVEGRGASPAEAWLAVYESLKGGPGG